MSFIFISGNGASGKSTFAKELKSELLKYNKSVSLIDTDNFLIKSDIRKSKTKEYIDKNGNIKESYLSSSFPESYDFDLLESEIKKNKNNIVIIEGVGSSFIKPEKSLGIFITAEKNIEFERRLSRKRNSADLSEKDFENRYEQFELFVLSNRHKFEIELESQKDFSYKIIKDKLNIF